MLRPLFQKAREFVKYRILANQEPFATGSRLVHPVMVQVTGQLFYDDSHIGYQPRGKQGMRAATLWEIHPVTSISFAHPMQQQTAR